MIKKEKEQTKEDEQFKKKSHRKIEMVNFIYSTREKLEGIFIPYLIQNEKEKRKELMKNTYDLSHSDDKKS